MFYYAPSSARCVDLSAGKVACYGQERINENDRRNWRNDDAAKGAADALSVCVVLLQLEVLMSMQHFSESKGNFSLFSFVPLGWS